MRGRLLLSLALVTAATAAVSAGSAGADTPAAAGRTCTRCLARAAGDDGASGGVWLRRRAQSDSRPTAGRCAGSSTRRQTSSASRRSWLRPPHRVPSTTSRFRRSSRTRRCLDRTRPAHPRSDRTSTPWRRSTSRPGRDGSRATARPGMRQASPHVSGWPPPASTSRRATPGCSTS